MFISISSSLLFFSEKVSLLLILLISFPQSVLKLCITAFKTKAITTAIKKDIALILFVEKIFIISPSFLTYKFLKIL